MTLEVSSFGIEEFFVVLLFWGLWGFGAPFWACRILIPRPGMEQGSWK